MRISDWSSDVCSSDLVEGRQVDVVGRQRVEQELRQRRGLLQARVQARCAFAAHQGVRVLALGQEQEERLAAATRAMESVLPRMRESTDSIARVDRKSTRLNSSHQCASRMPSSAGKKKTHNKEQN